MSRLNSTLRSVTAWGVCDGEEVATGESLTCWKDHVQNQTAALPGSRMKRQRSQCEKRFTVAVAYCEFVADSNRQYAIDNAMGRDP